MPVLESHHTLNLAYSPRAGDVAEMLSWKDPEALVSCSRRLGLREPKNIHFLVLPDLTDLGGIRPCMRIRNQR